MPYTAKELLERYKGLPKALQEAITRVDTAEIIKEVGQNHKLMIDKVGELADETGLVMLGLVHPKDYIPHLIERLNIDRETTRTIADEINNRIFFPVREYLKKIHRLEEAPEPLTPAEETPTVEMPKPEKPVDQLPMPEEKAEPSPPSKSIFEAKTQEGVFRQPLQTSEKIPEPPAKKIDPYREPV